MNVALYRVKGSYQMGQWKMMVDIELQNNFVEEEVENLLQIALICTQIDPIGRPTMLEVVSCEYVRIWRWLRSTVDRVLLPE